MYNPESIGVLKDRVGWFPATEPTTIIITPENVLSESGVYVNSFHSLATVENVNASINNKAVNNDTLNQQLSKIKIDAAAEVLLKVFNLNTRATARFTNYVESINYSLDYSNMIIVYSQSFTECIGLAMAIKALELLRLTERSNLNSNNYKISQAEFAQLMHGSFTDQGVRLTEGIYAQYRQSIGRLIDVLFPTRIPQGATQNPDGSVNMPPVLRARRIW